MQKTVKLGTTRKLILDVISTTGEVDGNTGYPIKRTSVPRKHFRAWKSLFDNILKSCEIAVVPADAPNTFDESTVEFVSYETLQVPEGKKVVGQRFPDAEFELSDGQIEVLRMYWEELEEVPNANEAKALEAYDEVEALLAV